MIRIRSELDRKNTEYLVRLGWPRELAETLLDYPADRWSFDICTFAIRLVAPQCPSREEWPAILDAIGAGMRPRQETLH